MQQWSALSIKYDSQRRGNIRSVRLRDRLHCQISDPYLIYEGSLILNIQIHVLFLLPTRWYYSCALWHLRGKKKNHNWLTWSMSCSSWRRSPTQTEIHPTSLWPGESDARAACGVIGLSAIAAGKTAINIVSRGSLVQRCLVIAMQFSQSV